jgi:signal transduction histidine kinase
MTLKAVLIILLSFILTLVVKISKGQELVIKNELEKYDVLSNSKIYISDSDLSIQSFKNNQIFLPSTTSLNPEKINWILFKIKNKWKDNNILYLKSNFLDSLTLYNNLSNQIIGVTGNGFGYDALSRKQEVGYIKIELARSETLDLVLKINGEFPKEKIKIDLIPGIEITKLDEKNNYQNYSLLAIILSFFVFNFLVYIILKDKTYLYYLLYLFNLFFYLGSRSIVKGLNLEIETYIVDYIIVDFFLLMFNVSAIKFSLSYLEDFTNSLWKNILNKYLYLFIVPIILSAAYYRSYYEEPQNTALAILSLTTTILILIFTISRFKQNKKVTTLFLIAELPMILGGMFVAFEFLTNNLEPSQRISSDIFKISVVLEILLFSFALGNKYREQRLLFVKQLDLNEKLKIEKLEELKFLSEQKNKELEYLVNLRTNELRETNENLIKLNKEKNKIFSIIGHDLRSPLASLIMMLELFNSTDLTEDELKEMVKITKSQLISLNGSIENLFAWAQSQMEGLTTNPNYFELDKLVLEKINLLKLSSEKKNINIKVEIEKDFNVYLDRNHLGVVFQNVINNAIKFTRKNGLITISAHLDDKYATIKITDNGIGIDKELLEKLNSMQQIQSSKGTEGEKGTGLGLLLCRELIEKNNGTLKIESIKNEGTSIILNVPLNQNNDD